MKRKRERESEKKRFQDHIVYVSHFVWHTKWVLLWMLRIYDRNKFSVTFNRTQHSPKLYTNNIQIHTRTKNIPLSLFSISTKCIGEKRFVPGSREWIELREKNIENTLQTVSEYISIVLYCILDFVWMKEWVTQR